MSANSQSRERLVIFGAGGFGREVAWLAGIALPDRECVLVVDREEFLPATTTVPPTYLLSDLGPLEGTPFVVGIGDPAGRRTGVEVCKSAGMVPASLLHPNIDLRGELTIGEGAVICTGVVMTTGIELGAHVQLNLNTTVGHDTSIGDFSTLAPGVNISGNVHIGKDVYVGTGASIINGSAGAPLMIGDSAIVAAGACVTRAVEPGALVAGVPAVRKR